jgi:hypothetical protein
VKRKQKTKTIETPAPVVPEASPEPPKEDAPDTAKLESLAQEAEMPKATEFPAASGSPKKRGRPPGSKRTPEQALGLPRSLVKVVLQAPYALIAKKWGTHWELSDAEAEPMIDPHIALANRYLPDVIKQNPELYTVVLLHGLVVFAKAEAHYKLMRELKRTSTGSGVTLPEEPAPETSPFAASIRPGVDRR